MTTRQLPPLNALRAFEATARLRSFTAAARELRVTPAAISHQVKTLEEHLNTSLFYRKNRSVTLTPATRRGLQSISHGFELLLEGVERLADSQASPILNLSVSPSFAATLLIQWLPDFHHQHPDIDVRISSQGRQSLLDGDDHAVLQLGAPDDSETQVTKICQPGVQVWCHPSWLQTSSLKQVEQLLEVPRLHYRNVAGISWQEWLRGVGMKALSAMHTPAHSDSALDEAAQGKGFVLASASEVKAYGDALQPAFPKDDERFCPSYYLFHDKYSENLQKLNLFKTWLLHRLQVDCRLAQQQVMSQAS